MKNVVISGADRNIGLELAKQFLNRGWRVFAGQFLMELPLLDELKEIYPNALRIVPMDVSNEESVLAAAEQVAGEAGQVDKAGEFAAEYFIRNRSNEPESYRHSDENRLVMREWMGIEIPW